MKIDKYEILICSLKDKEKNVAYIRKRKQTSNDDFKLKIVRRVIKVKEEAWLKLYINMNTKLRKNDLEKDFFKFMSNSVIGKTMENIQIHRCIKLVTKDKTRDSFRTKLQLN